MRKWFALLVCIALAGEMYWLYQYVEGKRVPVKPLVEIPQDNPLQRTAGNLNGNTQAGAAVSAKLPNGPALIRGLLRDVNGDAVQGVVLAATPAPGEGENKLFPHKWSVVSDEKGEYKIEALPLGAYLLSAVSGDTHYFQRITLTEEQQTAELRGTLLPSFAVRGRVVDEFGKDLQGVKITPLADKDGLLASPDAEALDIYAHFPAYSESNGEFTLDYLQERPWRLLLSLDGFANTLSEVFVPGNQRLALVMNQGLNLAINLSLYNTADSAGNFNVELVENDFGIERYTAQTDNAGILRFGRLRPANWRVSLLDSPFVVPEFARLVSLSRETGDQTIDVALVNGAKISGSVNRNVRLEPMGGIGVIAQTQDGLKFYRTATDDTGAYTFQGLVSGTYQISLSLNEEQIAEAVGENPISATEGEELKGPDFVISRGYTVQGIVKNADGNAAQGAVVRLENPNDSGFVRETKSDSKGAFLFKGLKNGQVIQIVASLGGVVSEPFGPLSLDFKRQGSINLTLSRPNRGSISGSVVNAQGRTMAEVFVLCTPEESLGLPPIQRVSGKFGDFRIDDLVPGTYTLTVGRSTDMMAPQSAAKLKLDADHAVRDLQLLLP